MEVKVISFGLWGDKKMYCEGAVQNCILAKEIYPDWDVWIYYDIKSVSMEIVSRIEENGGMPIPMEMTPETIEGMFWRFLPATKSTVDVMISRDCDSRLNSREKACVDEWLVSGKMFHIMRDHPHHGVPILGGMWGIANSAGSVITKRMISDWGMKKNKGEDQVFLANIVWPKVKGNHISHDERFNGIERWGDNFQRPFPKHPPMKHGTFVGEIFYEQ